MTSVERVLEEAVGAGGLPGVAAAYATRDGMRYCGAAGMRCVASADPLHSDSIFRIASMTKAITTFAALQLVDAGKVDLDEDVAAYLPELGKRQLLEGFDENGKPKLRPPRGAITLRQLLTHTAGFGYSFLNTNLVQAFEAGMMGDPFEGNDRFLEAPLVNDPGTAWEYGINTDWVGRLVETLSDQTLEEYFQAEILGPLGMEDTAFNLPADKKGRIITVHQRGPDGVLTEDPDTPPEDVPFHAGGHGLYSTAGDYLRFLQAVLRGGELDGARILSAERCAEASRDQIAPLHVGAFKSAMPALCNDVADFVGAAHGLGFLINPEALPTGRSAGSLAWAGIFNSYYWIDPTRGISGVYLSQILPFYDSGSVPASHAFEAAAYASL
ncbi:MAG: beta-lactamase family protein [Myxococcales bacterium]|nr:beta-lactamase family protein [Myxococcales bacterium]